MLSLKSLRVQPRALALILLLVFAAHNAAVADDNRNHLSQQLTEALERHGGKSAFQLPSSRDYSAIPQDRVNNPITAAKVELGKLLFHETGVATATASLERSETYSCATCHHAAAGFKAGITQGIGDGGSGFARRGAKRRLAKGMNPDAEDGHPTKPDFQPVTSPAALNAAYQDVMLWDGALGNANGSVNSSAANLLTVGPPNANVNKFGLPGLETQVLAGTRVHRLNFDEGSILQTNRIYRRLYENAFPDGTGYIPSDSNVTDEALGAAKAIAAFERTILANRAPFQRWLKGNRTALSSKQLRGALLFFDRDKANCVACHTGPALSSAVNDEDKMFFNVGFEDLNTRKKHILGSVSKEVSRGRGNFTGNPDDDYKFKVPQLYNLADTKVFGHGGSFNTIKQVLRYKNRGIPQRNTPNMASEFQPLGLNRRELDDLEDFIKTALRDPNLARYQPKKLPSGNCFPAADFKSALDLRCW